MKQGRRLLGWLLVGVRVLLPAWNPTVLEDRGLSSDHCQSAGGKGLGYVVLLGCGLRIGQDVLQAHDLRRFY